jgi:arginyl-tRNA synthetase
VKKIIDQITDLITSASRAIGLTQAFEVKLEHPAQSKFGEWSTNVALTQFAQLEGISSPRALAELLIKEIHSQLDQNPDLKSQIADITVAGPGFINFHLSDQYFKQVVADFYQLQETPEQNHLISQLGKGHQAVVEYSSPNIAKPFTIGHLRSTIIGSAIANILEATGYKVYRDNHLGDWGTQFGKQIYAIKTWGNEQELEESDNPVKLLVDLYVKFHQEAEKNPQLEDDGRAWFKKLEDGDSEARRLWQKCIDWSWKEFKNIYDRLGVTFTENQGRGYGESFFEDKMTPILEELEKKKLLTESKGAQLVFFPDDVLPPMMIVKKDGASLYATRDLATDKFRFQHYGQDVLIVNEVGAEQALYFKQLYLLEQMLGWCAPTQRVHVKHGLYRFNDRKMSTRKGNVIWLSDVLSEAFQRVKAEAGDRINDSDIWAVAIGALKWNDLKRTSQLDVVFDWDELLKLQGNSGPYLQYTWVRCHSILNKASQLQNHQKRSSLNDYLTLKLDLSDSEKDVIRCLTQFDEVVTQAALEYAPHHLCTYLYNLAQSFNAFYAHHSVLGEDVPPLSARFRLDLTQATSLIIKQGLGLLGIQTVDKM